MIDNHLLVELIAFAKYTTLAAAAEHIGISQPAITRGLQKLEAQFGVKLFKRTPNRITLTKTGEYTVQKAQQLLAANATFIEDIRNFNHNQETITVASIAPGPLLVLNRTKISNLSIQKELIQSNSLAEELLLEQRYSCVITNQPIKNYHIHSSYLGQESLFVKVNAFSNLGSQHSITFKNLSGLSFIVLNEIGAWTNLIHQEIPDAKFIYQSEKDFIEIRNNSIFPYFVTNLTSINPTWEPELSNDRILIKISDKSATMNFYANFLTENQEVLLPLINLWQDEWENFD
ncbi:TPA: LysR family transcriptional regulator [Enterococcus faecium]|uniref:LysR family transcriptional regulator n=1 Tax=Enterococcus lactis TaxID=357441 RepID=UPI00362637FF